MLCMINDCEDVYDLIIEVFGKVFMCMVFYVFNYVFSIWLYKIVVNNCIDFVCKKKLMIFLIDECIDEESQQDYSSILYVIGFNFEEVVICDQCIGFMCYLFICLSDKYCVMIELCYFKEMSYDEIVMEFDILLGIVKVQLF